MEDQELEDLANEAKAQLVDILRDLVDLVDPKNETRTRGSLIDLVRSAQDTDDVDPKRMKPQRSADHALSIILGDEQEFLSVLQKIDGPGDRHYGLVFAARLIEAAFTIGATSEPEMAKKLVRKLEGRAAKGRNKRPKGVRTQIIKALLGRYKSNPILAGHQLKGVLRLIEEDIGTKASVPTLRRAIKDVWPPADAAI